MTIMPTDIDNNPIPALRLKSDGAQSITVTDTSARNATAFHSNTRVVSLYATGPVHIKFGNSGVTATTSDHYFPSGVYYDFSIGGGKALHSTHVAVIAVDQECDLYISEKE